MCVLILFSCLHSFLPFLFSCDLFSSLFVYAEPMLPLSGAERRKYLADMKAKKVVEGYAASDPTGVLQRKVKRKYVIAKVDTCARGSSMDMDNVETAADDVLVEQSNSPIPKKMKIGKGGDPRRTLPANGRGEDDVGGVTRTSSLNAQVEESFWHADFDFRMYGSFVDKYFLNSMFGSMLFKTSLFSQVHGGEG